MARLRLPRAAFAAYLAAATATADVDFHETDEKSAACARAAPAAPVAAARTADGGQAEVRFLDVAPAALGVAGGTASAAPDRATINTSINATVVNKKTRFINRRDPFCRGTKEERVFSARSPCLYSIIKYRGGNAACIYARWLYLFAVA